MEASMEDCPHEIRMSEERLEALEDPLFQVMLPLPQSGAVFYLNDAQDEMQPLISELGRLSALQEPARPLWSFNPKTLPRLQQLTNLAPLVITQCTTSHQAVIDQLAMTMRYYPRTVILTGQRNVVASRPIRRITTELTLEQVQAMPLEKIGAAQLRRLARKEK